jgi:hypothetical protein
LRLLLLRRFQQDRASCRTLPRLVLRLLRVPRVRPHLRARPQLIQRRIPRARCLRQLHLRLQLQLLLRAPALRLLRLRHDPACRCGHRQHREARPQEHVLRQRRLALHGLLAHPQPCNVILVPAALLLARDNRAQVLLKACALLVLRSNIVPAARRRVVPVVRPGSVRVGRLRGSRNALAAVADQVVATIRDQLARSGPAREFLRPNQASRSMLASPRHAVGR